MKHTLPLQCDEGVPEEQPLPQLGDVAYSRYGGRLHDALKIIDTVGRQQRQNDTLGDVAAVGQILKVAEEGGFPILKRHRPLFIIHASGEKAVERCFQFGDVQIPSHLSVLVFSKRGCDYTGTR